MYNTVIIIDPKEKMMLTASIKSYLRELKIKSNIEFQLVFKAYTNAIME
jgi:hypothetical protein